MLERNPFAESLTPENSAVILVDHVLAELANNTVKNGVHIADLLTEHTGSYAAAWNNFSTTGKTAEMVKSQLDEARQAVAS